MAVQRSWRVSGARRARERVTAVQRSRRASGAQRCRPQQLLFATIDYRYYVGVNRNVCAYRPIKANDVATIQRQSQFEQFQQIIISP